ncbi:MAG: methyltransferase domain-containing protein [Vulcanimicrobiaceae bacterium]
MHVAKLHAQLVATLCERGAIRSANVEAAFRRVPRHVFIPGVPVSDAYADRSIPIKFGDGVPISSSSQPAMMAEMLERLALRAGDRVLEIGAGSGYNAALLADLVGPAGFVATIDLDADLADGARRHLAAAGFHQVRTICADGTDGDLADSPFDAIIATIGVGDIPPAWISQLRIGGRLVMPLAIRLLQRVVTFQRTAESLASTSVIGGSFMMLRGRSPSVTADPITLGAATTMLRVVNDASVDREWLVRALREPAGEARPSRPLTVDDVWSGLALWLNFHDEAFCRLDTLGAAATGGQFPNVAPNEMSAVAYAATLGLYRTHDLAVFALSADGDIVIRHCGEHSGALRRLQSAIDAWDDAGRPADAGMRIEAFPRGVNQPIASCGESAVSIAQASTTVVVRWVS